MTTAPAVAKPICPECRRENEPERIYCHECGARLDRTALRAKKEPIQETHKRVKRMFDPQRAKLRALFFAVGKLVLGALLLAGVIEMVIPPELPSTDNNGMLVSSIRFDLETMVAKHQPPEKRLTEEQLNAFIASALKNKQGSLNKPLIDFNRLVVALHEQRCAITIQRSLAAGYWPVYMTCLCNPEIKNGRLSAGIQGARIGRLAIHPKLAQYMGPLFGDVIAALERDLKLVSQMSGLELHEKTVTLKANTP